jgi:hypothetical protein
MLINRRVILELLDPSQTHPLHSQTHPLQSWTFSNQDRILIGRSPENDVIVSDPYVSRSHAYLQFEQSQWRLISISSQQIIHDGHRRPDAVLLDQSIFRLGSSGCFMRFCEGAPPPVQGLKTLTFDTRLMPVFHLDDAKLQREANEISGSDYFKTLKERAAALRGQR